MNGHHKQKTDDDRNYHVIGGGFRVKRLRNEANAQKTARERIKHSDCFGPVVIFNEVTNEVTLMGAAA